MVGGVWCVVCGVWWVVGGGWWSVGGGWWAASVGSVSWIRIHFHSRGGRKQLSEKGETLCVGKFLLLEHLPAIGGDWRGGAKKRCGGICFVGMYVVGAK